MCNSEILHYEVVQVSAELSLWNDCLRAYHMLCQLDSKFLDVEILRLLVEACGQVESTPSPSSELN